MAKRRFTVVFFEREESKLTPEEIMDLLNHGRVPWVLEVITVNEDKK